MTTVLRRGSTFHYSETIGGRRIRCALGTSDPKSARRLAGRIGLAVADGPESDRWSALRLVLPPASYRTLATGLSVTTPPDLAEFEILFKEQLDRREKLGEIAASTHQLYESAAEIFFTWLAEQGVYKMDGVTPLLVEKYQIWRSEKIAANPRSKNGMALKTDSTTLAAIFALALEERVIQRSPLRSRFRAYGRDTQVEPFSPEEMGKLETATTEEDRLLFLVFKWTGLRGSDAAGLTWGAFDNDFTTLRWETRKRGVWITIPVSEKLKSALVEAYPWEDDVEGYETDSERVFPAATRAKLYSIIRNLGERAGVKNSRPHRFRHTLGCTILEKGGTIYDVAKILGDHVSTVEKHYAPFTERLQERVRKILDSEAA